MCPLDIFAKNLLFYVRDVRSLVQFVSVKPQLFAESGGLCWI